MTKRHIISMHYISAFEAGLADDISLLLILGPKLVTTHSIWNFMSLKREVLEFLYKAKAKVIDETYLSDSRYVSSLVNGNITFKFRDEASAIQFKLRFM